MIKNLYIKDFAIIEEIDLPMQNGFTVITGETGAGKSIILQALNVSLGGKTTKTMIRSSSEKAIVESTIDNKDYRRILNKSGRAKSFINDEPLAEGDFRQAPPDEEKHAQSQRKTGESERKAQECPSCEQAHADRQQKKPYMADQGDIGGR